MLTIANLVYFDILYYLLRYRIQNTAYTFSFSIYLRRKVGLRFEIDAIHFLGKLEAAETLAKVLHQRVAADNRERFGVSAETVLEQPG